MSLTLEEIKSIIYVYADKIKSYPVARQLIFNNSELPKEYAKYIRHYGMSIMDIIESCNLPYKLKEKTDKYTDNQLVELYKSISKNLGKTPSASDIDEYRKNDNSIPAATTFRKRFGSVENLADICGLFKVTDGGKYKNEFLKDELKRYFIEFGQIPTQKEIDENKNYPSRKTFTSAFGTFNNALREAGFDVKDKPEYSNKDYLLSEIRRYVAEFGKQPFSREMDEAKGYPSKSCYTKTFGSWNNAIKEAGLRVRVSQYTNKELDDAFFSFVNEYGRPPVLTEFNADPRYPSFWCYQNRFGSWNKTMIHYGFDPIEEGRGFHFQFENGEVCKSTYEYDVSKWLRDHNISYLRNVPYGDMLNWYDGKKDCDYVVIHNGEWIWLEVAGFYTTREKKSSVERDYIQRFNHKLENLLIEFNYKVFYPDDFKQRTLNEMFSFLWEIESRPWFENEPVYHGIAEEYDEVV